MTDQTSLPGQRPEQLHVLDVKNRLAAMAREISTLDVAALANAAESGSWEEELAVAALDFKRRLRQTGVFAQLAILAHAERRSPGTPYRGLIGRPWPLGVGHLVPEGHVSKTSIEWTRRPRADGSLMPGYTFNGWWGCTEAGPECDNCYARTFSHRLGFELWGADAPRRFFGDKHWGEPFKWDRKARELGEQHLVFCQSMSDVLEDRRDLDSARGDLWCLIESTPNLIWLLLTKRPGKFATLTPERWRRNGWPPNVWAGATSGTQRTADVMIPQLQRAAEAAAVLWLSVEPLLERVRLAGAIQIGRPRISWVIVGAESGGRARPMQTSWVQSLRDECINAGAAFFFKQDAVGGRKISMPLLDGRVWREFPRTAA